MEKGINTKETTRKKQQQFAHRRDKTSEDEGPVLRIHLEDGSSLTVRTDPIRDRARPRIGTNQVGEFHTTSSNTLFKP